MRRPTHHGGATSSRFYGVRWKGYFSRIHCFERGKQTTKLLLKNGWTKCFGGLPLRNGNVVLKVTHSHSQSRNDSPLCPWAVLTHNIGKVVHAHCDCAAGLVTLHQKLFCFLCK